VYFNGLLVSYSQIKQQKYTKTVIKKPKAPLKEKKNNKGSVHTINEEETQFPPHHSVRQQKEKI
jgi:hypothetical protein